MPNIAIIPRAAASIGVLTAVVDGYPAENHRLETAIGGEPLEDGRNVTDHAVAREERLTLTGFVSDFQGGQRPAQAWEAIRTLQRSVTPVDVVTEWATYPEMLIRRAEAPKTGRGMRFTLELQEVIRVGVIDILAVQNPAGTAAFNATQTSAESVQGDADAAVASIQRAGQQLIGNTQDLNIATLSRRAFNQASTAGDRVRELNALIAPVQDISEYPTAEATLLADQAVTAATQAHNTAQSLNQSVKDADIQEALADAQAAEDAAARVLRTATQLRDAINEIGTQSVGAGRSGTVERGRVSLLAEGF